MIDRSKTFVKVPGWEAHSWLRHGFSTRHGGISSVYDSSRAGDLMRDKAVAVGDLNLGWTRSDDPANVAENRRRLLRAIMNSGDGECLPPLITIRQVHSAVSLVVPDGSSQTVTSFVGEDGRANLDGDGLMTDATGMLLGIQTADCVPVFVVDTTRRIVGSFHAGWRGTATRIVEKGVAQMISAYGSRPCDLIAAIGPSIGVCCYSVGEVVLQAFAAEFSYGEELFMRGREAGPEPLLYLDLWEANRRQLLDSGLAAGQITVLDECTGCIGLPGRRRYFSHRCEQGFTGRMMNVIGVFSLG